MATDKPLSAIKLKKGALRKQLGTPAGKNIPEKVIAKKISALKKKSAGAKKLPPAQLKEQKRLVLARTFKGFKK